MSSRSTLSIARLAALSSALFIACGCSSSFLADGPPDAARTDARSDGRSHDGGIFLDATPEPEDAGPDGGWHPLDAGCAPSSCATGERCVDGDCRCGAGPACGFPVTYCHDACIDRPTLVVETADSDRCADLGTAHAPPEFLYRITVHGRPGASGTLETIRRGCPPITSTSAFVVDAAGLFTETQASMSPVTDCTDERIGIYQYRATVDAVPTEIAEAIYYDSICPSAATCGLAELLRACSP